MLVARPWHGLASGALTVVVSAFAAAPVQAQETVPGTELPRRTWVGSESRPPAADEPPLPAGASPAAAAEPGAQVEAEPVRAHPAGGQVAPGHFHAGAEGAFGSYGPYYPAPPPPPPPPPDPWWPDPWWAEGEIDPGYHRHDGLFLRLLLGIGVGGYLGAGQAFGDRDPMELAPAGMGSVALGGEVSTNLLAYGELWGHAHFGYGLSHRRDETDEADYFGLGSMALGLSYYFMPANVYVAASVGPAWSVVGRVVDVYVAAGRRHSYEQWIEESETGWGLGATLGVGKEWWVSDDWGLGVGARGQFGYTMSRSLTVRSGGTMLVLSTTCN